MPFPFQAALAADVGCSPRNAIERMFCRLKDFRRIATGYDRLATNFLGAVCIAEIIGTDYLGNQCGLPKMAHGALWRPRLI